MAPVPAHAAGANNAHPGRPTPPPRARRLCSARGAGSLAGVPPPPFSLCCTSAQPLGTLRRPPDSARGQPRKIFGPHPRGHCSLRMNRVKSGIQTPSSCPWNHVATTPTRDRRRGSGEAGADADLRGGPRGAAIGAPPRALPGSGGPPLLPPPAPALSPLPPPPPSPGPPAGAQPAPPSGSASAPRPCGQPEREPRGRLRRGGGRRGLGWSRLATAGTRSRGWHWVAARRCGSLQRRRSGGNGRGRPLSAAAVSAAAPAPPLGSPRRPQRCSASVPAPVPVSRGSSQNPGSLKISSVVK